MSRVDQVSKNIRFSAPAQFLSYLANFVVRWAFTRALSQEYLGLNGLFADILNMLSLAELGFGWLCPAVLGLGIGMALHWRRKRHW